MGKFDKGRKGGKSFGGKPSFGDRGGRPSFGDRGGKKSFGGDRGGRPSFGEHRSMFQAVCNNCQKKCEVPFRPTGDKPVLCDDCFRQNRSFDNRPSYRSGDRDTFVPKNKRSDRRDEKPAYQSAQNQNTGGDYDGLKKQVDAMNVKIENIMRTLEKMSPASPVAQSKVETSFKKVMTIMPTKKTAKSEVKAPAKKTPAKKAPVKKAPAKTAKKVVKAPAVKKVAKGKKK